MMHKQNCCKQMRRLHVWAVPVKAALPEPVRVRHSRGKTVPQIRIFIRLFATQGQLHASLYTTTRVCMDSTKIQVLLVDPETSGTMFCCLTPTV